MDEQEIVSCKQNDLKFPKLESFNPANAEFRIIGSYKDKYNSFHIMSVETQEDEHFRLSEEILDIAENPEITLGREPELEEVVLAPKERRYHRALVLDLLPQRRVKVYFFDMGGFATVGVDTLKPLNAIIKKFPVVSSHVVLDGMTETSQLLSIHRFETLMQQIGRKILTVEESLETGCDDVDPRIRSLVNPKRVKLFYEDGSRGKVSLSEDIKKLEVWEWESHSNLKGTDDQICATGAFGNPNRSHYKEAGVRYFDLEIGAEFTAQVAQITTNQKKSEGIAILHVVLLDDPCHANLFNVLHAQMNRYAEFIQKSDFFPAFGEPAMLKIDEKYKGLVKMTDTWVRAIRNEDLMHLIDLHDYVPFLKIPDTDCEFRRLYGEFMEIPILAVTVYAVENGRRLTKEEAEQSFVVQRRYAFKVVKRVKEGGFWEVTFAAASQPDPVDQIVE